MNPDCSSAFQPRLRHLRLPAPHHIWGPELVFSNFTFANDRIARAVDSGSGWAAFVSQVIDECYADCSVEHRQHAIALTRNIDALRIAGYWLPGGDEQSVVANMAFLLSLYCVDDIVEAYRSAAPSLLAAMTAVWREMPAVVEEQWRRAGRRGGARDLGAAALSTYGGHDIPQVEAYYRLCAFVSAAARVRCASDGIYARYAVTSASFIRHHVEVSLRPTAADSLAVEEVIRRRILDSAVAPTFWNLVAVSGAEESALASAAMIESPSFEAALDNLCIHIGIINDIFSYQREHREGSSAQVNFVDHAYRRLARAPGGRRRASSQLLLDAVNLAIMELNASVHELSTEALAVAGRHDGGGTFMARAMVRCLLGSIKWSLGAPRYSMKKYVLAAMHASDVC